MSTLYSVGQMNQLGDALGAAGFTPDDVTKLRSFLGLHEFKDVLQGHAHVVRTTKHVIDCDVDPYMRDGWKLEEHKRGWQLEWDPSKVSLYLSDKGVMEGVKLRKELDKQSVLNANVLDYLLVHPELIPEHWKKKLVFFWGTIYRSLDGRLCVRCLDWGGDRWGWRYGWLDGDHFHDRHPAVVRAGN